jgi:hypothetical protein
MLLRGIAGIIGAAVRVTAFGPEDESAKSRRLSWVLSSCKSFGSALSTFSRKSNDMVIGLPSKL